MSKDPKKSDRDWYDELMKAAPLPPPEHRGRGEDGDLSELQEEALDAAWNDLRETEWVRHKLEISRLTDHYVPRGDTPDPDDEDLRMMGLKGRGDQAPELTPEDEEILDRIWAESAAQRSGLNLKPDETADRLRRYEAETTEESVPIEERPPLLRPKGFEGFFAHARPMPEQAPEKMLLWIISCLNEFPERQQYRWQISLGKKSDRVFREKWGHIIYKAGRHEFIRIYDPAEERRWQVNLRFGWILGDMEDWDDEVEIDRVQMTLDIDDVDPLGYPDPYWIY